MKRLLFTICLCIAATVVKSQTGHNDSRFSYATTFGTGIPVMNTPSKVPFTWQVLGYYNLTERWALGAGSGLSFYEKLLIPTFGDVRFQIGPARKFTPYAELGVGYAFSPSNNANGGFFLNPSFGIQYPLRNRMKLQLAIGAELQELERLKKQTDDYFQKEFKEKLSHHAISLKIGIVF